MKNQLIIMKLYQKIGLIFYNLKLTTKKNHENFNEETHNKLIKKGFWQLFFEAENRMIFEKALDIIEGLDYNHTFYTTDENYVIKLFGYNWAIKWIYDAVKRGLKSVNPHINLLCYHPYLNPLKTKFYYPYFKRVPQENMDYINEIMMNENNVDIYTYLTCKMIKDAEEQN